MLGGTDTALFRAHHVAWRLIALSLIPSHCTLIFTSSLPSSSPPPPHQDGCFVSTSANGEPSALLIEGGGYLAAVYSIPDMQLLGRKALSLPVTRALATPDCLGSQRGKVGGNRCVLLLFFSSCVFNKVFAVFASAKPRDFERESRMPSCPLLKLQLWESSYAPFSPSTYSSRWVLQWYRILFTLLIYVSLLHLTSHLPP